jgi:GntR family transcriptional regulator
MLKSLQPTVEKAKKNPIYADVADTLEKEIAQLQPNSLLPTEEQLSKRFGISRVTIRAALDMLERSGRVSRLRGRGTIVSPPKVVRHFAPLFSLEKDLAAQGVEFETRVLSFGQEVVPPEVISRRLKLSDGEPAGRLELVRLVEDRIVCQDLRYYPVHIARSIDPRRAENEDTSEILRNLVGAPVTVVDWESEIVSATIEVAEALGVASRTLVLANLYTWYLKDHQPVEAGFISYRVDRCKFKYAAEFSTPALSA